MDMACATLPDFIVLTLEKNQTVAVDATADMEALIAEPFDKLLLAGVPEETVEQASDARGKKLNVTLACLIAESLDPQDASDAIRGGRYERIFGQLGSDVAKHLESIAGTSGGPVFGLWYSQDGSKFQYTILGIQSGWDSGSRQLVAWPLGYVVKHFSDVPEDLERE